MGGITDKVSTTDKLTVELEPKRLRFYLDGDGFLADSPEHLAAFSKEMRGAPRFPCPNCGKETLEHTGPKGTRICSAAFCRHVTMIHADVG